MLSTITLAVNSYPVFIIFSSFSTSIPCKAGFKAVYRLGVVDGRKKLVMKGNGLLFFSIKECKNSFAL